MGRGRSLNTVQDLLLHVLDLGVVTQITWEANI